MFKQEAFEFRGAKKKVVDQSFLNGFFKTVFTGRISLKHEIEDELLSHMSRHCPFVHKSRSLRSQS